MRIRSIVTATLLAAIFVGVKPTEVKAYYYTKDEINMIAICTMAEAEGQCEKGQRWVIDTILNRVENEAYPSTVEGVLYQKNQYYSMTNGRAKRCYAKDEIVALVQEEILERSNPNVYWFRTKKYGCGTPIEKVGDHYFSGVIEDE